MRVSEVDVVLFCWMERLRKEVDIPRELAQERLD